MISKGEKSMKRRLISLVVALTILTGMLFCVPITAQTAQENDPEYLLGDANLDGTVDITDATWIMRADAGMITLGYPGSFLADVDRDGDVNIVDTTWLQRWELDMKAPAGIGEPIEVPSKYSFKEYWAYYGEGKDAQTAEADIFIIAPTVDKYDEYNMTLDDNNKFRLLRALNMEKGIYEDNLRMYSPYYAQASFKAYELSNEERKPYIQIAYQDVSEAFAYYLEHYNNGRPIVLFGYSQGAELLYDLLEDYFGDPELSDRLVAAYAIGWGCTYQEIEQYPQIVPASGEDDYGCLISFDAEAPEVEDSFISPKGEQHFCINPLNWKTDTTFADKTQNKGAVFVSSDYSTKEIPQFCGAYIDLSRGVLKVPDVDPADYPPQLANLPDGAFHAYDLYFFWNNLKENIAVRTASYFENHTET